MARKEKKASFLSPQRLLTPEQYARYREERKIIEREKLLKRMEARSAIIPRLQKQTTYDRSKFGSAGKRIASGFQFMQSPSQFLNQRSTSPIGGVAKSTGVVRKGYNFRPGRPKGTYDQRYAAYGGVYGWRKAQALERFKQRQEILRNTAVTPRQQMILAQINARDQYNAQNVESQIIPDTKGGVHLKGIFDEVDAASRMVD
jgi:hypothetical protein